MTFEPAREAYERAACGLLTTSADGAIERVNATMCGWTGFTAEELQGRSFQSLLTMGSRLFHQTHWAPLLELQGSVAEVQLELLHRDGQRIPALVNAARRAGERAARVPVDIAVFIASDRRKYERELLLARRRAEELLGLARDAEAGQLFAEARLRLALESASLGVWSVELPGGERRYERGVRRLLGRPDLEEVTDAIYRAHMDPEARARDDEALAAALDPARRAPFSHEYRLLGGDGVERIICSTGQAYFDALDRPVQFSGLLSDITDHRRAELALHEQKLEAQRRATLAEQLIGIVSHDLRNPLNAVMIGAELLGDAESREYADTARRVLSSAQYANRLVGDLLDFTQARLGGGLRIHRSSIDPHAVVADCLAQVRLACPGRAIEHRRAGEARIDADPDRLVQVVSNLVGNALAYGSPNDPVTVTTTALGASAGLELSVHNAGPPIPDEVRPHIFEPMRRGARQKPGSWRSVGLGLYIVRQIALAHGGDVSVRSTAGEGTTFTVGLPRG